MADSTQTAGVECFAPAKVNLGLHVTGMANDGYHLIDSLVAFADIGDRIMMETRQSDNVDFAENEIARLIAISGPFSDRLDPNAANLAVQAAQLLAQTVGPKRARPLNIRLEKNLPVAGGIGGGSADAAAVLRGCRHLWKLGEDFDLTLTAAKLGADVPMCLHSSLLHASGTGEETRLLCHDWSCAAVLFNPGIAISTRKVFEALENKFNEPMVVENYGNIGFEAIAGLRNDLEQPAMKLFPEIRQAISCLQAQPGCRIARMSGSGATCFGLFDDRKQAKQAQLSIGKLMQRGWCVTARLGSPKLPLRRDIATTEQFHEHA